MDNINPMTRWGVNFQDGLPQTDGTSDSFLNSVSGNVQDLWLATWSGEVLHAYDQFKTFEGLVDSRTITSGTTVQFPVTGTVALKEAWEAGEELAGGGSTTKTYSISLDRRPIAAHFELDNIDVMVQQFEFRSELARQAGQTIANERDAQLARLILKASQEDSRMFEAKNTGVIDTDYAGRSRTVSTAATAGSEARALEILAAIEAELVKYRELNVVEAGTVCVVSPADFNAIRRLGIASPTDTPAGGLAGYQPMFAGVSAAMSLQSTLSYMGVTIMQSNVLPADNFSSNDSNYHTPAAPAGSVADPVALIFQRGCVASIKKQGLKVDSVEDVRRNTVFTVASMFSGGGVLRPELACAVRVASA